MRFEVVTRRNVGNHGDTVVATTRRFNGALAEQDRWLDSARKNARKHNPDGRVVVGPTGENEVAVVSFFGTHEVWDFCVVRPVHGGTDK
jgi:hypothetical protein